MGHFRGMFYNFINMWVIFMVNIRRNGHPDDDIEIPNLEAMVAAAIANMLPSLNANEVISRIVNDVRNGAGSSGGSGGGGRPTTVHGWLKKFSKLKPLSFSVASIPQDAKDWITHMEKLFEELGCEDELKTRLATFKLEGDAERFEREYNNIYHLENENFGDYMLRFLRLASFVGPIAGDAKRQAKHFKWGQKKWVLDRLLNTDFVDVSAVNDSARNIEIFLEGSGYKRNRDGDRIQHRAQSHDSREQMERGRSDQSTEYRGRYQVDRSQDSKSTTRTGNDRQGIGNRNNRKWKDQSSRGTQQNLSSGSSSQHRPTENLTPPPLCPTCGKHHPGTCYKLTGAFFRCSSTTHRVKDCPKGNSSASANTPRFPAPSGRVFTTTCDQAADTSDFHVSVKDASVESPSIDSIPIIRYFADVFPDELPGLPPAREVEFSIDLVPGNCPMPFDFCGTKCRAKDAS
ncbi:hypothetical protein CTI12_AA202780 [Artemisia annua]|uniref:Zinc finger, CCHC-type, Retrotransposon gag domain protein n=1 Tax=Artemisia annua TaxID=35608 RepID=A0A2U1P1U7_ARTAN|nr:hypothetical protein CTI12_AA202780 [Artemisia annua]